MRVEHIELYKGENSMHERYIIVKDGIFIEGTPKEFKILQAKKWTIDPSGGLPWIFSYYRVKHPTSYGTMVIYSRDIKRIEDRYVQRERNA